MAVTSREQQVLDLQEQGLSNEEIGARLRLQPSYVQQIRSRLAPGLGSDRLHNNHIAAGSRALLKAILAARAGEAPPVRTLAGDL